MFFKDRLLVLRRMTVLLHEVAAGKAIRWSWLPASFFYNFLRETTLPVLPFRVSAFRLSQLPMLIISLGTMSYTLISMPWGLVQWATSKKFIQQHNVVNSSKLLKNSFHMHTFSYMLLLVAGQKFFH